MVQLLSRVLMDYTHFTDYVSISLWTYDIFLSLVTAFGTGHLSIAPTVSSFSGNFSF